MTSSNFATGMPSGSSILFGGASSTLLPNSATPVSFIPQAGAFNPNNELDLIGVLLGTRLPTDYTPFSTTEDNGIVLKGFAEDNEPIENLPGMGRFSSTSFNAEELQALTNSGIKYGTATQGQFLDLLKGYVLFALDKDIVVQLREGTVYLPKGSIAWVMETGNDSAIYDLHDSMTGPVRVVVNKKYVTMQPGSQLLLTRNQTASFDDLNPGDVIPYRRVQAHDMGEGIKMFRCDFSIPHSMGNVQILRKLVNSDQSKDKKMINQMLKNAVILSDLTAAAGPYKQR